MAADKGRVGNSPWRKVVEAIFEHGGGRSIFPPYLPLGNEWTLKLECGHTVQYAVRYRPVVEKQGHRGYMGFGWNKRRYAEDALPAPKRVRCVRCKHALKPIQRRYDGSRKV